MRNADSKRDMNTRRPRSTMADVYLSRPPMRYVCRCVAGHDAWFVTDGERLAEKHCYSARSQASAEYKGFAFERAPYAGFYRFPSARFHEIRTEDVDRCCDEHVRN